MTGLPTPMGAPSTTNPGVLGELILLDDVGPARRGRVYPAVGPTAALLLPAGLLLGGLVLWPALRTVLASVTNPVTGKFVGLANFRTALAADGAWAAVGRTVLWAAVVPAVVTVLGYLLAAASRRRKEGRLVQLILVAPIAVPLVVAAVVFRLMYDPDPGRGTAGALSTALFGGAPVFLGPALITVSLMSAFVWAWIGLAVVVFRAALDSIPSNLADAVRAYGGTRLDVFRDARWRPLVRRTVALVFVLVALATSRTFDLILVLAPGSVRDEASVLSVRVWQTSGGDTSGPGAALGVLWLAAVAVGMTVAAFGVRQAWPAPAVLPPAVSADRAGRPPSALAGFLSSIVPWRSGARSDSARSPGARSDSALAAGGGVDAGVAQEDEPSPAHPRGPVARVAWAVLRAVPSLAALAWVFPLLVLVATSVHSRRDAATSGWWRTPISWQSYRDIFVGGTLTNSLVFTTVLAVVVTVVVLSLGLLAAYPLAALAGPGAQTVGVVLLGAAVVPVQVIAGPVNEVLGVVRLGGSAPGLALVHMALGLPFAIMMLRNALADVPAAQLRRARLAGRQWEVLRQVARAVRPAVIAVTVLEFVQVWNDLAVGLLFGGPDGTPLGLLVYGESRGFVANSGPLSASSVLVSIVPLLLVILARKQVIAGLVFGALR